jgi:hypothetical protein
MACLTSFATHINNSYMQGRMNIHGEMLFNFKYMTFLSWYKRWYNVCYFYPRSTIPEEL